MVTEHASAILGSLDLAPEHVAWLEETAEEADRSWLCERAKRSEERARRQEQLRKDLAYLEEQKITLLREGVYDAATYTAEVRRIEEAIKTIDSGDDGPPPSQIVQAVLNVLELVKMAQQTFVFAEPQEKQEILASLVLELVVKDGKLAEFTPKEGVDTLLKVQGVALCADKTSLLELLRQDGTGIISASARLRQDGLSHP